MLMMVFTFTVLVTTAETATTSTTAATTMDFQPQMTEWHVSQKTMEAHQVKHSVNSFQENASQPVRGQRTHLRRRMPGVDYDLESAEAGFVAGLLCVVLLLILLCCCCCGGGRGGGCSLWDIVAIACLWEICCDRDGAAADSFMML
jgi:hypothetical protein